MTVVDIKQWANELITATLNLFSSPPFFAQGGAILLAVSIAYIVSLLLKKLSPVLRNAPRAGSGFFLRKTLFQASELLFPLFTVLNLSIAISLSDQIIHQSWLVRIAEIAAVLYLAFTLHRRFINNPLVKMLVWWMVTPLVILQFSGKLDEVTNYLETLSIQAGNINISAYGLIRATILGLVLFWFGRLLSKTGQRIIRSQQHLEVGTREVFAKLLQVGIFVIIFILLLQMMGINLTTLAVFGGALGVGLGFGLQSIASNFISGIIILLDRSLTVGDYIELEDGRLGIIRELNMRSTTLETFDGKDVMVPNERFITSQFINWTHKNKKQRYDLEFSVAYKTDLHLLFKLIREVVASHPQVLSGEELPFEEQPDAEIKAFGDSGIEILVEFWMEDIDDGKNRVRADLLLMIWDTLKENNIEIPFPQREVKIINPKSL